MFTTIQVRWEQSHAAALKPILNRPCQWLILCGLLMDKTAEAGCLGFLEDSSSHYSEDLNSVPLDKILQYYHFNLKMMNNQQKIDKLTLSFSR